MHRNLFKCATLFAALTFSGGAYATARTVEGGGSGTVRVGEVGPIGENGAARPFAGSMRPAIGSGAIGTGAMGTAMKRGDLSNGVGANQSVKGANAGATGSLYAPGSPVIVPNLFSCSSYTSTNCNPTQCVCALTNRRETGLRTSENARAEEFYRSRGWQITGVNMNGDGSSNKRKKTSALKHLKNETRHERA